MPNYAPDPTALRETLDRMLESETFARSERARKLLRYLVEQEQAGKADRLKGFAIAVDVFDKVSDFDSSADAQVRVQAGRLRELLQQYFASEGANEPIRIAIPRGSYVPSYSLAPDLAPAPPARNADARTAPPVAAFGARPGPVASYIMRQLRLFWVAFAVVISMLAFVAYRSYSDGGGLQMTSVANAAPASRAADAIVSLPKVFLQATGDGAPQRVAKVLRGAFAGFDTIVFISRPPPAAGDASPLDFAFVVDRGPTDDTVELSFANVRTGQVITSRQLSANELAPSQLDSVVADILTATLPVSGALYGYLEANGLQRGLTNCLLLNDDYYLDQKAEKHKRAYECFETIRDAGAYSPQIYSELASLHLEAVTDQYDYPPNASKEQALDWARQAVQMAPTSPYAHRAYGFLHTGMGNRTESIKWMKKASELGHHDLSMSAAYGYALIMAGKYAEGTPVMQRAVEASSARPSWWDYTLFLGQLMLDNKQGAIEASDALGSSKRAHYMAARLLAAKWRGDPAGAEKLLATIVAAHKKFADDPRAAYKAAGLPADLVDKLAISLAEAGLGRGS